MSEQSALHVRLMLVRHGETVDNARGVTQGWSDSELSDRGRTQVQRLADRLARIAPTTVYSSSLGRAVATAEAVAGQLDLEVRLLDDLREMNCGRWEGMPFLEIRDKERETYERWTSDPSFPCPGGESFSDVRARIERALATVERECGEENPRPLVVSHGNAIRIMATLLLDLPLSAARHFMQDNAALNIFERRKDRYLLRVWNDATHCNGDMSR